MHSRRRSRHSAPNNGQESFGYLHGYVDIIPSLECELKGCTAGFNLAVHVAPADGDGEHDPQAVFDVSREQLSLTEDIQGRMRVQGGSENGVINFTMIGIID